MLLDTLRLEPSGVPIYVQIREQVLRAVGAGLVRPGEKMPTMRQVAVALKVDLNTVRHAYDALARLGVITILPARGTFVAEHPPAAAMRPQDAERLDDFAHRTIAAAAASGLDPVAVAHRIAALIQNKENR